MKKLILAAAILAACDAPKDDAVPKADVAITATDTTVNAPASAQGDTSGWSSTETGRATAPTQFDAKTIKAGEKFGGLTVATANVAAAQTDVGASGAIRFSGQAELTGSYRAHFDYPEVKQPCFWVDVESWGKLPRARGDTRIVWFCFENAAQAISQLGALGTQARATIVVDNYTTNLQQSDVWDTARLVRVVKKEGF
ncbi:MAG TPA: hypothetical protein VGC44_06510 [Longimicrobiales bacterium]